MFLFALKNHSCGPNFDQAVKTSLFIKAAKNLLVFATMNLFCYLSWWEKT